MKKTSINAIFQLNHKMWPIPKDSELTFEYFFSEGFLVTEKISLD